MDNIIHLSVVLKCDVKKAFELFTINTLLEHWLTQKAEVEPKVGGDYQLFWEPEDRENNSTIGCKITALTPERFLAFEWKSPRQFKHFANTADPLTHVVVMFHQHGETTEVNLIHSGWRQTSEWEEARLWQKNAWQMAFEQLRQFVNASMNR